ncbi:hypothetical protein [Haloplanus salilacus]|uniref:hypothetical protein n=1 Tax=Haloplanus salilacus TaxID=2949994 RepID=UPI0030CC9D0D
MSVESADTPDSISIEITHEEAFGPLDPDDLEEDERQMWIDMEADIQRSEALREIAEERLDVEEIPEATHLLWIDEAEVYPLCPPCYDRKADAVWTGGTEHPHHGRLRSKMQERLQEGTPCADCKDARVRELKDDLKEQVDVEVTVVDD